MKRTLLFLAAGAAAAALSAEGYESPCIFNETTAQKISPNGRYFLSQPLGGLEIFDLEAGTSYQYVDEPIDDPDASYNIGHGNPISDTGIVVGTTNIYYQPAYWQSGEWHLLDQGTSFGVFYPNGITPDGKRICGNGNIYKEGYSSEIMQLPLYWDATDDGFGEYKELPCPTTDFTGRAPQHINALSISDDGKVIYGQIIDFTGMYPEPICYTQAEDGTWSYSLPLYDLFRPADVIFPEYPEDFDMPQPFLEDYMTQEEIDAYNAVLDAWYDNGYNNNIWDYANYPNIEDYASPEAIAAYNAASEIYNEAAMEFNEKLEAFNRCLQRVMAKAPLLTRNLGMITPDGKDAIFVVIYTKENDDPMAWLPYIETDQPCRLTLANGEMKIYDEVENVTVWSVQADGGFTAGNMSSLYDEKPMNGYVERDGKLVPLFDYIQTANPDIAGWMEENMIHDVISYELDENYELIENVEEMMVTGVPLGSRDLSTIVTWTLNVWDEMSEYYYFAYYFKLGNSNSVECLKDKNLNADSYEVYNMKGVKVMATGNLEELNSLEKGIYVVKSINTRKGLSKSAKVAI